MALIKSISGIRGTIGNVVNDNLTPLDLVRFTSAYAQWLKDNCDHNNKIKVILGRDARISGSMVEQIVSGTLMGMGIDVINLDLATTPTVEVAVPHFNADGGIILTASHNPKQWNALKLLNNKGEFLSGSDGEKVLQLAAEENMKFAEVDDLGSIENVDNFIDIHIQKIIDLPLVDIDAIKKANFTVAIDCVNSVGGVSIPPLLKAIGVNNIIELYTEPNGEFPHNPEPLPEHLTEISSLIKEKRADIGFVVDPDVDRLAIINEDGTMFGEEYTLVAVADYILSNTKGNTVSNMSSTRALRDVTVKHGGSYTASAVGEVNVVVEMKNQNAVIGGEGNGGIIYPELHYGRDALVGIALFLTHLAKTGKKCSELRATYPQYTISKNKIELTPEIDVDKLLIKMKEVYASEKINDVDGVKIDFEEGWVHLRKSNTEPIIRIYAEGATTESANNLAQSVITKIKENI
ncbi:MAG: phosphoglucosamine mutase [Bacteroidales bacterium]|jgi:phosphomannomutase|nr:phosphoglucosamine mutase [Bacteroidales bacterium]